MAVDIVQVITAYIVVTDIRTMVMAVITMMTTIIIIVPTGRIVPTDRTVPSVRSDRSIYLHKGQGVA
jgi:hypothetical protein